MFHRTARILSLPLVFMVLPLTASAQEKLPEEYSERPAHAAQATAAYHVNCEKYKGVDHILILPGLIADRRQKRVQVFAEATGIEPGVIVEFLLIDAASSKGYEALLWSHARPSHIHRALEFIGIQPGAPFRPGQLRFWPKGERVLAGIGAVGQVGRIPLESLIVNKSAGRSLPAAGFVFTGSMMVQQSEMPVEKAYAADVLEPRSIASIYNDSTAVLDVPRRAPQYLVYGKQLVAPACQFGKNELLTITFEPEYKDGRKRVVDVSLSVAPAKETTTNSPIEYELADANGRPLTERRALPDVLGVFGAMKRDGHDLFVSVRFSAELNLEAVRGICRLLQAIDTERGIRIEPPSEDQLYYEAFLPDYGLLDRERRIADPWEVHLASDSVGALSAELTRHESKFVDGERLATVETNGVSSGKALRKHLDAEDARRKSAGQRPGPGVLLVFADSELSYGLLVEFLAPAMKTHKVVHVFPARESGG